MMRVGSRYLLHGGIRKRTLWFMATLVTGVGGFIGFHVVKQLLARGEEVVGIDNLNNYYSPKLKADRLQVLSESNSGALTFHKLDFSDSEALSLVRRQVSGPQVSDTVSVTPGYFFFESRQMRSRFFVARKILIGGVEHWLMPNGVLMADRDEPKEGGQ